MGTSAKLLFVCTGNICRSALAERLTAAMVDGNAGTVEFASAGTQALVGQGIHPYSVRAMRQFGGDPEGFAARQLTAEMVADSHLVLTATRQHRAAVVALSPRAVRRTFTLLEFGALMKLAETGPVPGDESSLDRVETLLAEALAVRGMLPHQPEAFDIADPFGAPQAVHDEVAARIHEALTLPIRLIAGVRELT